MKRALLALVATTLLAAAATAAPDTCEVPDYLTHVPGRLPHVVAALKEHRLNILVVGTGSSTLKGPNGAKEAYPARLQASLAQKLPGVAAAVSTDVQTRRTTADMIKDLQKHILDAKPDVVLWQTGTVDAMRNIDPDDFRAALEKGAVLLRKAGVDLILVNMQYSPHTEPMITPAAYADAMRWVAEQNDLPLFDRLAIMKYWSETGTFDFSAPHAPHLAERVHDCFGKLIAALIIDTAGPTTRAAPVAPPAKAND
jgi:hypothetical protein